MASERYLRGRVNTAELNFDVMVAGGVRLLKERVERLSGTAANEVGERQDVLGLGGVELRGEAPGKDAKDDGFRNAGQGSGAESPIFEDCLEEGVGLCPWRVERERPDLVGILGTHPQADSGSEGESEEVGTVDAESIHERGDIVSESFGGIRDIGVVRVTGPAKVERDASEVLGKLRHLEGITAMIGSEVGNENDGIARALLLIIHGEVGFDLRHGEVSFGAVAR